MFIFVSQAIHQDNEKRSILFKCAVWDLDLMVLADSNFHGKDRAIEKLKAIDDTRWAYYFRTKAECIFISQIECSDKNNGINMERGGGE